MGISYLKCCCIGLFCLFVHTANANTVANDNNGKEMLFFCVAKVKTDVIPRWQVVTEKIHKASNTFQQITDDMIGQSINCNASVVYHYYDSIKGDRRFIPFSLESINSGVERDCRNLLELSHAFIIWAQDKGKVTLGSHEHFDLIYRKSLAFAGPDPDRNQSFANVYEEVGFRDYKTDEIVEIYKNSSILCQPILDQSISEDAMGQIWLETIRQVYKKAENSPYGPTSNNCVTVAKNAAEEARKSLCKIAAEGTYVVCSEPKTNINFCLINSGLGTGYYGTVIYCLFSHHYFLTTAVVTTTLLTLVGFIKHPFFVSIGGAVFFVVLAIE